MIGDVLTYIEDVELLGEFPVMGNIEEAGSLSIEAPNTFDDLVAGNHSGLLLNNRQGSWVDGVWVPAPLFSPNKSSFFLSGQDWYNIQVKIELGWAEGSWFRSDFGEDEWLEESYSDFITLFLGRVKKWGPVTRAVDSPNNVEVYATDLIIDCLQKRICLPATDGTPAPLTYGEFLCLGEAVSGWSPAPVIKSVLLAEANFNELDQLIETGGGDCSLIEPGIVGDRGFECKTTGASQEASGALNISGGPLITGTVTFVDVPETMINGNMKFLQLLDGASEKVAFYLDETGTIAASVGEDSNFNVMGYLGVPLDFALWYNPEAVGGCIKLWINGDEVYSYRADLSATPPTQFRFGAQVANAETWTVVFESIRVRSEYYNNAFKVSGGAFTDIGAVYVDNVAQPPSKSVGAYTQTLTRMPLYGMVQFASDDPDFEIRGDVQIRVIENAGGRHALAIIEDLLDLAGLTAYIDATALAAAYIAVPDDVIHARFEGGVPEARGLKDYASLGLPIADALKEICSRCLYWIFVDAGRIKIVPYTAAALVTPTDPLQIFTASNKWQNDQEIDLENVNAFVTVIYGWYERNPLLHYVAGVQEAGGQGTGLDFSWAGPVATENRLLAVAKADLLLKFLSAQEFIDPMATTLAGARLEVMTDVINLTDELLNDAPTNYLISSKEVGLDKGNRVTTLKLIKLLGE